MGWELPRAVSLLLLPGPVTHDGMFSGVRCYPTLLGPLLGRRLSSTLLRGTSSLGATPRHTGLGRPNTTAQSGERPAASDFASALNSDCEGRTSPMVI